MRGGSGGGAMKPQRGKRTHARTHACSASPAQPLGDDVYELGVHIADVSFFVQPGNALDEEASRRATSTYLVTRVIPMLPSLLCEEVRVTTSPCCHRCCVRRCV